MIIDCPIQAAGEVNCGSSYGPDISGLELPPRRFPDGASAFARESSTADTSQRPVTIVGSLRCEGTRTHVLLIGAHPDRATQSVADTAYQCSLRIGNESVPQLIAEPAHPAHGPPGHRAGRQAEQVEHVL